MRFEFEVGGVGVCVEDLYGCCCGGICWYVLGDCGVVVYDDVLFFGECGLGVFFV